MPTRLILSAYAGPMPRPVVPILFLPRKRSVTLSMVGVVRRDHVRVGADAPGGATSTPRAISASSSRNSASGETTTPLAITEVQPGVRMPLGSRWVANFSPLTTMVWPALWPPLVRTHVVDGLGGGEQVGRLALALVAPLGSEDHDRGHRHLLPARARWRPRRATAPSAGARAATRPLPQPGRPVPAAARRARVRARGPAARDHQLRRRDRRRGGPRAAPSAVLREHASRRGRGDLQPRRARRRAAPRGGSRRIVVAGGDGSLHAVVAALHRRHELDRRRASACCRWAPATTSPAASASRSTSRRPPGVVVDGEVRPMDLIVDELGEVVVNNVHVGAGAQASRRGARWKERLGSVGRQGQPRQARLPDRRRARRVQPAVRAAARRGRRRGRHRLRPAGADGRGRQRRPRRRRHRAHPRGRPRGRQAST